MHLSSFGVEDAMPGSCGWARTAGSSGPAQISIWILPPGDLCPASGSVRTHLAVELAQIRPVYRPVRDDSSCAYSAEMRTPGPLGGGRPVICHKAEMLSNLRAFPLCGIDKPGVSQQPPAHQKEENLCTVPDPVQHQYTIFIPGVLDVNLTLI